jgi:transposase
MAYREVAMWEILNVLRRLGRGESKSSIAQATGHSRSTIRRYDRVARELGWSPGAEEPGEELAAEVGRRLSPAADRAAGEAESELLPHEQQIRQWLTPAPGEKRGLRLTKVHELLARRGVHVPYSSLHRFAIRHCGFAERRRITVRMAECAPGEVAEVDFGLLGLVQDPQTGRRRRLWALVVVLVSSRHQYVHVTHSQQVPDVIGGLEDAWEFFGGTPRRVIVDNLAAAINKADRYDPIFQRTFEEYASYRGFLIDPTRVRDPTGKPHVERAVPYVRESFFRGEQWQGRVEVQQRVIGWCLQKAGTRIHGTTRKRPLALFENIEREALTPLSRPRFDPPRWARGKVHPDHHISFEKALYSVPTRFVGESVWVRADSKLVRIYCEGELIKSHPKQPVGGRSTDHADYPPELTDYTRRDPQRLIRQAKEQGPQIGRFAEALLSGTLPWAKLRQGQKLLRLGEKYGWHRLELACQRALAFELINVRRVESILRQDLQQLELLSTSTGEARVIPLRGRFERPAQSFSHHSVKEDDHGGSETLA